MPLLDPSTLAEAPPALTGTPATSTETSPPRDRTDLGAIQVSDELAQLFHISKDLLEAVIDDNQVPANQKAQVLNSIQTLLERITKTRTELYNAETIRRIELAIVRAMKEQPQEVKEAFFASYRVSLAR